MKMTDNTNLLYHGSTVRIDAPLAHFGRPELDFGPGFYLTKDRQQAEDWSRAKAGRKPMARAILNIYRFDWEAFSSSSLYKTLVFPEYSIEWLDFISLSRKGEKPWEGFDCVEGGVANDSVISTVDAYVDGLINADQAIGKLVNERLRHQFCILNQSVIDNYLSFVESVELSQE